MRKITCILLACSVLLLGCGWATGVGAACNRSALLKLEAGMNKDGVLEIMGKPNKTELYPAGNEFWLYRTESDGSPYGVFERTDDGAFTPLCFQDGKLTGWGRNYYISQIQKYEHKIEMK